MPEESMTPDLVVVVSGLFEAADRGDWEALISYYAPDAIWETDDGIFDTAGASGVRGFLEEWAAMFEDLAIKAETVVDLGNGVVYSVCHQVGRPAGSTGVVGGRSAFIYEWTDGVITRVIIRADIDNARPAAERLAEERGKAVSNQNVAIVRRIYDEINARLEFPPEWFDAECVTDWTDAAPEGELIRGVDATNTAVAPYFGTFENFHVTAEEIVYTDQERVVVAIRDGGRIRGSDTEISSRYWHVWTFRDRKVVRLSSHIDKAGALKALGLEG